MRPALWIGGLGGAIAAFLLASWLAGSVMARGRASPGAPAVAPAKDVHIRSADGIILAGTYRPGVKPESPAVLLLHGVDASRAAVAENAAWLSQAGYATLAIDFRGHGQSTIVPRTFGLKEALDARAAFDWLKRRQRGAPVGIIGISLGGAASLIGDAGPVPAQAMILQAVYPDIRHAIRNRIASRLGRPIGVLLEPFLSHQSRLRFGVWPSRLSPRDALATYPGPVLIIGGEQDRSTPPNETQAMFDAANGRREFWLVPTGDHGAICDLKDRAYRQRMMAFLTDSIGRPSGRFSPASR